MKLTLTINSVPAQVEVEPDEMLLEVLRQKFDLRSVRSTCGIGICGACTALVNGEAITRFSEHLKRNMPSSAATAHQG
jgi:aerobic-type carbon monoxide dehydrogenase small subunit (CoxS/CutS family)